jgi:hypothetical protein
VADFQTPSALGDGDSQSVAQPAGSEHLTTPDTPVTEADLTAQSPTLRVGRWGKSPVSVFSGLGLATVFTLNALLSQPIAGFDYLASRMDAGGGPRSNRKGRTGKQGAAAARS